ncbi:MAG: methyltransferase domain-containing protein [Pseudomonadota bacterium]|nr:methyltransferase domain-containing protein [Pseudomonadota bacterium]
MTIGKTAVFALAGALTLAACGRSEPQPDPAPSPAADPYPSEPVNVDLWLERLEVGSRELYSARANVVAALDLKAGGRIADIGAGTGVYSLLFAERASPGGVVYAVDIEPRFLTLINQRADDLGLDNVVAVLGRDDSITLPPGSVDVVFICDTYHYFDDPAAILKTVFEALRSGGALYIVDYDLKEGETPPPDKRQVHAGKEGVAAAVEAAGFGKGETVPVSGLVENYMLRFEKP